ncbi:MAG: hypothetical protein HDP28_04035 [Clostridia bacterium]|nr:hypothetical protein [Clostridia bacterium]
MQKAKKFFPYVTTVTVVLVMACFLAFPARYTHLVLEGATLFAVCVMPATLPFLFLTAILTRQRAFQRTAGKIAPLARKAFRVSGAGGLCAVLSALSGYPVGARTVYDLYSRGAVSKQETFRLACLSSTSGPMFLVGAVGAGMFKSSLIGWILFVSHLLGVYLVCFLLRFTAKKTTSVEVPALSFNKTDGNPLMDSVLSVLAVGGAIAIFYAFSGILCDALSLAGVTNGFLSAAVTGVVEMTSGCKLCSEIGNIYSVALSAFLVTFGGGCVLIQQTTFLSRAGVKTLPFFGIKFLQGLVAALIALGLSAAIL